MSDRHSPAAQLTWAFIFQGLGLAEDRARGIELVQTGLAWWRRYVRLSEAGQRMFLYSLMAEGGLPQALLAQEGLYRRVVLGVLADIEAEGGMQAAPFAERIALRWVATLPQTLPAPISHGCCRNLLWDWHACAQSCPKTCPSKLSNFGWTATTPNWAAELPLRMSSEIVEQLIRPALGSAHGRIIATSPLALRELRRNPAGAWNWFLRLNDKGFLPELLLPMAANLRLRLLPVGSAAPAIEAPVYSATPDKGGWQLRRVGRKGAALLPLEPHIPFVVGAYADGRPKGEIIVAPEIPVPAEAPSLWRAADPSEAGEPTRLVCQPGSGRTRAPFLWLLGSETAQVVAGEGVSVEGPEARSRRKAMAGLRAWSTFTWIAAPLPH